MNTYRAMNKNTSINVASIVAPVLASRDVISTLKSEIEKSSAPQVQLNFAAVEFVSRSAAHELLRLKEWFATQQSQKTIEFTNTNEEVAKMLRTVASNRAVPKTSENTADIKTVSINDLETTRSPLKFLRSLFAQ